MASLARRSRYALNQGSRVALFTLHSQVMRRMTRRLQETLPRIADPVPDGPVPSQRRMLADIVKLFADDLASVEAGHYPLPHDGRMSPRELLATSRAFFKDVPEVARRRATGAHQEVFQDEERFATSLPRYYRQNFHFQTDGWLSEDSARLYDFQVDVLFSGATAAMRRRALAPFSEFLKANDQRKVKYVDLACGTSGLLGPALSAFPRLSGIGLDLSEPYLNVARDRIANRRASFLNAKAEQLPFADNSVDVLSSIFLFHELPPRVRPKVIAEAARVLKPGGRFIVGDSLQFGDNPGLDGFLEYFPEGFHEPYYAGYLKWDFAPAMQAAGFELERTQLAFLTKVNVWRKFG